MNEYDYKYRNRRRGPNFPLNRVHDFESLSGVVFWIVVAIILYYLFG